MSYNWNLSFLISWVGVVSTIRLICKNEVHIMWNNTSSKGKNCMKCQKLLDEFNISCLRWYLITQLMTFETVNGLPIFNACFLLLPKKYLHRRYTRLVSETGYQILLKSDVKDLPQLVFASFSSSLRPTFLQLHYLAYDIRNIVVLYQFWLICFSDLF